MANSKRVALTAIGAYVIHPKKQNLSFGRWAIPVMEKAMQDSDPDLRRKAVQSLNDFVFDSRRVASKEFTSVVPVLKTLCRDPETVVRLTSAHCLGAVTATASGRRVFEHQNFYEETLNLLADEDELVRKAANVVLQRLIISPTAAEGLVLAGAIPKLLDRVPQEANDILIILLHILHACCLIDDEQALECDGLEIVTPLLENESPRVKEKAAVVIKDLTVNSKGRNKAIELSTLDILLKLYNDEDKLVQAKSLSALMMIANEIPAKFIAIKQGAVENLLHFIESEDLEIRLNALKVLTALGEAPDGRKILLNNFQKIKVPLNDKIEEVQRATRKLIAVATFKP